MNTPNTNLSVFDLLIKDEVKIKTPRTDFVASQCNSDSEQSDLSAYHVMMAHAYELEREIFTLRELLIEAEEILCDGEWSETKKRFRMALEATK